MKLPKGVKEAFYAFEEIAAETARGGSVERSEQLEEHYEAAKSKLFEEINKMRRNDRRREK